ncbi:DUF1934 domain-containing protein [Sporosarcina ureilytica]|uniref:DUF1934 domain-containing protein n=1 Tax=Sporosarcina ureilytica TaxID=298596 RepID=A0A1D8JKQ9_9BACL|nr:DUF1934 domain-containing protein [Sporosarcina ureilytica]AOV09282.1 hypothetical protein BI350_15835 [Sporosarcina ureilytica]
MDSKTAGQTVQIRLHSSIQHPGQDKETHQIEALGRYVEKMGSSYLQYEEDQDGQKIQTTVKLGSDDALIMRSGAIKMRLPFSVGDDRQGEYRNNHVTFKLQVKTKVLRFIEEEMSGEFEVAYELYAEGSLLGTYELSITYSEGIK